MEVWNKEEEYILRSKDGRHTVQVFFWDSSVSGQKGIHIEIKNGDALIHFFTLSLVRNEGK
jgi:hypothetical protein